MCAAQASGGFDISGNAKVDPSIGFSFLKVGANAQLSATLDLTNQGGSIVGDLSVTGQAGFYLPWPCGAHEKTSNLLSNYQLFSEAAPSWWP